MQRSLIMLALAAAALLAAAAAMGALWYERPTRLTVAVSRGDEADRTLLEAAAHLLKLGRNAARLQVEVVDDPAAASAAVDSGKADLAVIRTDVAIPGDAETVVILHRDAAVLAAPPSSGIRRVSDLPGHTVGMVRMGAGNRSLLTTVLEEADLAPDSVALVPLRPEEIASALKSRKVAAVMAVDVVTSPALRDVVRAVAAVDRPAPPAAGTKPNGSGKAGAGKAVKPAAKAAHAKAKTKKDDDDDEDDEDDEPAAEGDPVFVPVREAEAIAQRSRAYEKAEVVRGIFGGTAPRPAKSYDTLSITHRLVANRNVSQDLVSGLTRFFLTERGPLAAAAPVALGIEAPDTDKGARLPVHPGSAAYIDDDEQTFFDKYSDYIYIGAMVLGVLASGFTAVMGRLAGSRPSPLERSVHRLVAMMGEARAAAAAADLDALQAEADGLMARALENAPAAGDERRLAAFGLALDQVRAAVRDRRAELHLLPRPAEIVTMARAAE